MQNILYTYSENKCALTTSDVIKTKTIFVIILLNLNSIRFDLLSWDPRLLCKYIAFKEYGIYLLYEDIVL